MPPLPISGALDILFLDAGNTVVFLDHDAVSAVARREGVEVSGSALKAVEGEAKRRYEAFLAADGSHEEGWGLYQRAMLEAAGVDAATSARLVPPLEAEALRLNLWRRVPGDLVPALERMKAAGIRLAIISNSEGRLPELFAHTKLDVHFERVIDSHDVGVRKPDPRIFQEALGWAGVAPARAMYAGDIPSVDVAGAQAVGMHAALIDPFDFFPDHAISPRYPSVAALVGDLLGRP